MTQHFDVFDTSDIVLHVLSMVSDEEGKRWGEAEAQYKNTSYER